MATVPPRLPLTPNAPTTPTHPTRPSASAWPSTPGFAILLALALAAAFPGVLLGLESFVFRDFGYYGYPLAHHLRESLWRGELPLWNPLNNAGLPFLAQWSTLVLYPPSLLFVLLPLPWSLNFFQLIHLWLGGLGAFLLARHWTQHSLGAALAGLAFTFNGLSLNGLIWPHLTAALAWMPWVILSSEKAWLHGGRHTPIAATLAALQILTGAPEHLLITWSLLALLFLHHLLPTHPAHDRPSALTLGGRAAAILVLAIGITAAQWWPTLELARLSHRGAQFATGSWSMPPWGWANFLVPLFHCEPSPQKVAFQPGQLWTSSYYLGLPTLALAALGAILPRQRRPWFLTALALACTLFALGPHGPAYEPLRTLIPELGFLRYPIKAVIGVTLTLPLLAAYGVAALALLPPISQRRLLLGTAAALLALSLAVLAFAATQPGLEPLWPATRTNGALRLLFLAAATTALLLALRPTPTPTFPLAALASLALLCLDLLTHVPWQNPTVHPSALQPGLRAGPPMPALGQGRAMISPAANLAIYQQALANPYTNYLCNRLALSCNTTLLDHLPVVDGFYSLYLRPSRDLHLLLYTRPDAHYPALMDFLGVTQITAPNSLFDFLPRPSALPLVTAGQQPQFVDEPDALAGVQNPAWDPRLTVFLPKDAQNDAGPRTNAPAHIASPSFTTHRIEFTVTSPAPTVAVIAQAWYPAWRATLDQTPTPLWKANHAFQAVLVPAGTHRVVLRYRDTPFLRGTTLSLATLALLAAWILTSAFSKPRQPPSRTAAASPPPSY